MPSTVWFLESFLFIYLFYYYNYYNTANCFGKYLAKFLAKLPLSHVFRFYHTWSASLLQINNFELHRWHNSAKLQHNSIIFSAHNNQDCIICYFFCLTKTSKEIKSIPNRRLLSVCVCVQYDRQRHEKEISTTAGRRALLSGSLWRGP